MTTPEASSISEARVEKRFDRTIQAITRRIRDVMGDMDQSELADRIGKSDSTVSNHLNGRTNLTLRTIVRYETALGEDVVSVPDVQRPSTRRRRRSGGRRVSEQRASLDDTDPVTRRLHSLLTDLTARIGQVIKEDDDLSQRELAHRIGRHESYVSRVLGGGVNLTLKTIAAFEIALDVQLLTVDGHDLEDLSGSYSTYETVPSIQESSDGGYCLDPEGTVTDAVTHSDYLIQVPQKTEREEELEAA
jgi:transcriptional regulator with XRE-family HTH domain